MRIGSVLYLAAWVIASAWLIYRNGHVPPRLAIICYLVGWAAVTVFLLVTDVRVDLW